MRKSLIIGMSLLLASFTLICKADQKEDKSESTNIKKEKAMKFELPVLPYATNELEPVISKRTIELHHGKHLQTYITN